MEARKQTKYNSFKKLWKHCQLTKYNFKNSSIYRWPGRECNKYFQTFIYKKQFKVSNKNLNFCPKLGYYNKKENKTDRRNFERKIKLKRFFELKNQDKTNENNSTSSDILISNLNQPVNLKKITKTLSRL